MDKEEYLKFRTEGHIGNILYEYYKEKRDELKIELSPEEFMQAFRFWGPGQNQALLDYVLNYYDNKFEMIAAIDIKTNKEIKFYYNEK